MHNEFCNLAHTWLEGIDSILAENNVDIIFIAVFQLFWQLEINGYRVRNNRLCGVKDITVLYGFAHGVAVKRNPHRFR